MPVPVVSALMLPEELLLRELWKEERVLRGVRDGRFLFGEGRGIRLRWGEGVCEERPRGFVGSVGGRTSGVDEVDMVGVLCLDHGGRFSSEKQRDGECFVW